MSPAQQKLREMRADKARPARDKYFHGLSPYSGSAGGGELKIADSLIMDVDRAGQAFAPRVTPSI